MLFYGQINIRKMSVVMVIAIIIMTVIIMIIIMVVIYVMLVIVGVDGKRKGSRINRLTPVLAECPFEGFK